MVIKAWNTPHNVFSSFPLCPPLCQFDWSFTRESLSPNKDKLSCCENSTPRKGVDEKCSFKCRYSPRWHFYSPWSNVSIERALPWGRSPAVPPTFEDSLSKKLINGTLKAQTRHQVGNYSFRCSVWTCQKIFLSNLNKSHLWLPQRNRK